MIHDDGRAGTDDPGREPTRDSPTANGGWPWSPSLDATVAAPASHRVLLDNDRVRVVEVMIPPGVREPVHTHRWPSVMIVDRPARIRYYGADGNVEFESPAAASATAEPPDRPRVEWMGPEGPHAVENIDDRPYRATRIELKGA